MPTADEYRVGRPLFPLADEPVSVPYIAHGEKEKATRNIPLPRIPGYVYKPPPPTYVTQPTSRQTRAFAHEQYQTQVNVIAAIRALMDGKLPTNAQLEKAIDSFLDSDILQSRWASLSPDGQALLRDVEGLLESVKEVLREKNQGMRLQKFLYHSKMGAESGVKELKQRTVPSTAEGSKEMVAKAWSMLRILFTNTQFRNMLLEFGDLAQDFTASLASSSAGFLKDRPLTKFLRDKSEMREKETENRAKRMSDRAARRAERMGRIGIEIPGKEQRQELSEETPKGAAASIPTAPMHSAGTEAEEVTRFGKPISPVDSGSRRSSVAFANRDSVVPRPLDTVEENAPTGEVLSSPGYRTSFASTATGTTYQREEKDEEQEAHEGQDEIWRTVQAKGKARDDFEDTVSDHSARRRTIDMMRSLKKEHWTEERRRTMAEHLKRLMLHLQEKEEFQEAAEYFIGLASQLQHYATTEMSETYGTHAKKEMISHSRLAWRELKHLLENFAGGMSLNPCTTLFVYSAEILPRITAFTTL